MGEQGMLLRLAAFTESVAGGNPAGVWVGDRLPDEATMQRIAAEVGYSETAFVAPASGFARTVRYFSPQAEVDFCGHATIAAGVALARAGGDGVYRLDTRVGHVPVAVSTRDDGLLQAALTSVEPRQRAITPALLDELLAVLCWRRDELDPALPPALAYAGAWHAVLAAATPERLARLDYDFDRARALMLRENLTTLQLVWRADRHEFHARNPFPVGGVVEDPATGAAAAALGGYLRANGLIEAPAVLRIRQGEAIGRPSELLVRVPAAGGIEVVGTAVTLG